MVLLALMAASLCLGLASTIGVPLFSDSAFHASVIREILRTGIFPTDSPVGWVVPDLNPTSYKPFLTHPPAFYMLNAILSELGLSITAAMTISVIAPTAVSIFFFYRLVSLFFKKNISLLSALLLTLMPMSIWLSAHRIMEPYQYLMSICSIYFSVRFARDRKWLLLILAAIFSAGILYIKITSLFAVVGILIYLLLNRVGLKPLVAFCLIILTLYAPYIWFSVSSRGTVSYAPPGLPILDRYVFKPWWDWPKNEDEATLDQLSGYKRLYDTLRLYDSKKRSHIQDQISGGDITGAVQDYSAFSVSESANANWFSSENILSGLALFFFTAGLFLYAIKLRQTGYHYIIIPIMIPVTAYLTQVTELRYFFILNILLIAIISIGATETIRASKSIIVKVSLILFAVFALILTCQAEILHVRQYKNSLLHNVVPAGQGISELSALSSKIKPGANTNVFTPANSEVSYYLNTRTIWDYRMLFIPQSEIEKYLTKYRVQYLIIPNFYTKPTIYSFITSSEAENNKQNWEGTSIPMDSGFYKYLMNGSKVKTLYKFGAFTVYERSMR